MSQTLIDQMLSHEQNQLLSQLRAGKFDEALETVKKFPGLVDMRDEQGKSVLIYAAYGKGHALLRYLLSSPDVDPKAVDNEGLNAFDWAILSGNESGSTLIIRAMMK